MPTGKRPAKEIADYMGKVTLVPNLSCLFFAGTNWYMCDTSLLTSIHLDQSSKNNIKRQFDDYCKTQKN